MAASIAGSHLQLNEDLSLAESIAHLEVFGWFLPPTYHKFMTAQRHIRDDPGCKLPKNIMEMSWCQL